MALLTAVSGQYDLLWSQVLSLDGDQLLRSIYLIGEATPGPTAWS